MAVQSAMLPLGTPVPSFSLVDVRSGETVTSSSFSGRPLLLTVICNHCPYVVRIKAELARLGGELAAQGISMVAVSSNDVASHPADGPEEMRADAERFGYGFPYLFDESQELAQALRAMCTPEFYLFAADGTLVYRGRYDASTPGNSLPIDGGELRNAVRSLLSGEGAVTPQHPSIGCSIKWKPGNIPDYLGA